MKSEHNLEADTCTDKSVIATLVQSLHRAATLAELIRLSGAALIVFALSLFLMQGVDAVNDLQRYHLLLLQTSLLGVAGFAVGYWLKEPRGARVFFSLGLVSIPANLAVLGAMVYSIMPATNLSDRYPDYASWQASSLSEIALAIVTGLIVIVPMSIFAFSVLARQSRTWLTCGYLFASSALLLPIRGSMSIILISAVVAVCMVTLITNRQTARPTTLTIEERFSRGLLFLPSLLMLARSAVLYSSDFHFTMALVIATYILLRQWSHYCSGTSFWTNTLHVVTALSATWLSVMLGTVMTNYVFLPGASLVFILVLGGLLLDLSRMVASGSIRWLMHAGWALLCVFALLISYLFWDGTVSFVFSLLVSSILIGSGFAFRSKLVAFLGVIGIGGNLLLQASQITGVLLGSNWMTVAIIGGAVIVCGSLIERHGVVIKLKMQALAGRWQVRGTGVQTQLHIGGSETEPSLDSKSNMAA